MKGGWESKGGWWVWERGANVSVTEFKGEGTEWKRLVLDDGYERGYRDDEEEVVDVRPWKGVQ